MKEATVDQLGAPSLRLKAFQLWVHGRQFPEAQEQRNGNWLNVTVHCGQSGASVWATGEILNSIGLVRFRDELQRLHETLSGEAVLESDEPNLRVRVATSDGAGHLAVRAEITPDHLAQGHWFEFEIDWSDLRAAVAQLESVLTKFPVKRIHRASERPLGSSSCLLPEILSDHLITRGAPATDCTAAQHSAKTFNRSATHASPHAPAHR
jgi:hypothetical protein